MWSIYMIAYYLIHQIGGYHWYTNEEDLLDPPINCWQKYISRQPNVCKDQTLENRIIRTLEVETCYLQESQRKIPQCATYEPACLPELTEEQFHVYTQFYNHWDVICMNEISKKIVPEFRLLISNVQTRISSIQEETAASSSTEQATEIALESIKAVSQENYQLLLSIFHRINAIHQHEVYNDTFNTALWYYGIVYCIIYAFTTFERTNYVRVYMFGILALSSLTEWYLTAPETTETITSAAVLHEESTFDMVECLWKIRHSTTIINTLVWIFGLYYYQDRRETSQRVLSGISENVADLKGRVNQLKNCDDIKIMPPPPAVNQKRHSIAIDTSESIRTSSNDSSMWPESSDSQNDEWKAGENSDILSEENIQNTADDGIGNQGDNIQGDWTHLQQDGTSSRSDLNCIKAGSEHQQSEQERRRQLIKESRQPCRQHNVLFCRACFNFNNDGTIKL